MPNTPEQLERIVRTLSDLSLRLTRVEVALAARGAIHLDAAARVLAPPGDTIPDGHPDMKPLEPEKPHSDTGGLA